jgi:D-alanine-D-alanine ligase-like ATP-grasp enzyme
MLPGCALLDALDTYHYIGIYEVNYKKGGIDEKEWPVKFDQFCAALRKETGFEVKVTSNDAYSKSAFVVFPADRKTGLDRVVVYESKYSDKDQELSLSIIKIPAGEDSETVEMKKHIESAFQAAGIQKWIFYIQRTHGQIFNS